MYDVRAGDLCSESETFFDPVVCLDVVVEEAHSAVPWATAPFPLRRTDWPYARHGSSREQPCVHSAPVLSEKTNTSADDLLNQWASREAHMQSVLCSLRSGSRSREDDSCGEGSGKSLVVAQREVLRLQQEVRDSFTRERQAMQLLTSSEQAFSRLLSYTLDFNKELQHAALAHRDELLHSVDDVIRAAEQHVRDQQQAAREAVQQSASDVRRKAQHARALSASEAAAHVSAQQQRAAAAEDQVRALEATVGVLQREVEELRRQNEFNSLPRGHPASSRSPQRLARQGRSRGSSRASSALRESGQHEAEEAHRETEAAAAEEKMMALEVEVRALRDAYDRLVEKWIAAQAMCEALETRTTSQTVALTEQQGTIERLRLHVRRLECEVMEAEAACRTTAYDAGFRPARSVHFEAEVDDHHIGGEETVRHTNGNVVGSSAECTPLQALAATLHSPLADSLPASASTIKPSQVGAEVVSSSTHDGMEKDTLPQRTTLRSLALSGPSSSSAAPTGSLALSQKELGVLWARHEDRLRRQFQQQEAVLLIQLEAIVRVGVQRACRSRLPLDGTEALPPFAASTTAEDGSVTQTTAATKKKRSTVTTSSPFNSSSASSSITLLDFRRCEDVVLWCVRTIAALRKASTALRTLFRKKIVVLERHGWEPRLARKVLGTDFAAALERWYEQQMGSPLSVKRADCGSSLRRGASSSPQRE